MKNERVLRHVRQVVNPTLLVLLLCADLGFLGLHMSNTLQPLQNDLFSLSKDGGYAEVFQYVKEYWIAILLFAVCLHRREKIYGAWALLFTYLLCDDALSVHERVGRVVARHWNYAPTFGLQPKNFGELTVSAVAGSAFLVLIVYFYIRSSNKARNVSKDLTLLLGLLIFFGVFVDMVQSGLLHLTFRGLNMIEDFGEMISMSMIASYVAHFLDQQRYPTGRLWRLIMAVLTGRYSRRAKTRVAGLSR